ncbi:MAG: three-Cys-motif partner protein TcmP [Alphaproteobacteria bacterium]|nr:three-Cys-motif partner protein TcmP [Rhizobiaceae bacterium]MBU4136984.1 three-Cys-motif partner protein TcmP [Alphaproteobacteria bacterium]
MVAKPDKYRWEHGAQLDDHSRRKHKILAEYFHQYLAVRCRIPQQAKFRLAVVDGFSGAGRYACGSPGSPLIFIEELGRAIDAINLHRVTQGLGTIEVECLLICNDADKTVIDLLKSHAEPLVAAAREASPKLHLNVHYMTGTFAGSYPAIKALIAEGRYRNVIYNLDQFGHSSVDASTLTDIMRSTTSAEIFYTFAIEALLAFLSKTDPVLLASQLKPLGVDASTLLADGTLSNSAWMGAAERLVFESFKGCATYVSPFSINNPGGWRYWLIHFANIYRARQVYNDILHDNSSSQAHFGRSGLNMLSYDPGQAGSLYLFDPPGRAEARTELLEDIPRLVSETGDAIQVGAFYETIYNATAAHKDDIHGAMIDSEELEVLTPSGGVRRKANAIDVGDTLRLKTQRSLFPMFLAHFNTTKSRP